jgi:hypothetical protein
VRRLAEAVVLLAMLAGCVSVGRLDAATRQRLNSGQAAIVMLRVVVTNQDEAVIAPFPGSVPDDNLGLMLGSFSTGGVPELPVGVTFPTQAARQEGWVYMALAPGYHYLAIQGTRRDDVFSHAARFRSVPRWRIAAPQGVPLVYAGTFRLRGRSMRLLLGDIAIVAIEQDATEVADEVALAERAAARDLPLLGVASAGPPRTVLAVRQSGPVLLGLPPR